MNHGPLAAVTPAASATPLRALSAALIDTETTGLDVATARVLELGVVALTGGHADTEDWAMLVNPRQPIPASSVAIHGITDDAIAAAPGFMEVWREFQDRVGDHLLMGYAVDFDLAVLKAECERHALPWRPPAVLDVRDLVEALAPPLPDLSLDAVAAWLGIPVVQRHRAAGDARLTAEILLALLPRLRDRGIRTVGEALEVCRQRRERRLEISGLAMESLARAPLVHVDSYAYRHRTRDVMGHPPQTIAPETPVGEALRRMVEAKISSLFVEPARPQAPWGIVTERDVLRALAAAPARALHQTVTSVASFPLETVASNDFLYRAYGRMRQRRIRHLGVVDANGQLIGALTQRDLIRQRADDALALTDALDEAATIPALAAVWRKLSDAVAALVAENVDARDIAAIISGEVCALTARAALIAEREAPPRPDGLKYALMVLGSGGRGESLLALDQDNAIVHNGAEGADAWLEPVGRRMNLILDEIGVPRCKGGVMAANRAWRLSEVAWRRQVGQWLSRTAPADILNADIFFDAVPVHGDKAIVADLRRDAIAAAQRSPAFLKLMAVNVAELAPPIGWFGRLRTEEDGRIDLKKGGIMPIFAAARILALKYGLDERSTQERLEAMRGRAEVPQRTIDTVLEAHRLLLQATLVQQLADIAAGRPPSSRVDPRPLDAVARERLRWALEQVRAVPDLIGDPLS